MVLNPQHLLTFALVARHKSITRAAELLHLGQPAVSGQLKLLQACVGEPLYERRGHQIVLTPTGEGLLEYAEKMARDFQQAQDYTLSLQRMNSGRLRLGSTMTIASYYLPRYLVRLQALHPGVQVSMKTGDSHEIVHGLGEFDLGFIEGPVAAGELPAHYRVLPWQEDEIVLVAPLHHPVFDRYPDGVPLSVFTEYQVIWREPSSGARQVVENALRYAGIAAPVNIEVTGVAGVKESVRAGLGIGFASSQALRHENTGLAACRINPPQGLIWHLNVITPDETLLSRAAKTFLKLCFAPESQSV